MNRLKTLRDERATVIRDGQAAVEKANQQAVDGKWTDEDRAAVQALVDRREALDVDIQAAEADAEAARAFSVSDAVTITGGTPQLENDPKRGFADFGQFAVAVMVAANPDPVQARIDDRLRLLGAPTSPQQVGSGADGGFLVPPEFAASIDSDANADDALLPLTREVSISGNSMTFNKSETTPWGATGVVAYWEAENTQATQSRAQLKQSTLRLHKLLALVPITEEMMADAPAIESFVAGEVGPAIRWKTNDALVNGSGAGQPYGVVGHGGTVSVAKETSQTAATINITNLTKMFARGINPMRMEWFGNVDTFPQLYDMKDNSGNRVWQTVTPGLAPGIGGLLLGRPFRFIEACPTLGTVGDLIFADWQQYRTLTKAGGVRTATSMHLWFDYDTLAFRATFRVDGQPWRGTPLSPAKGSATRGHFVTLATRA